MLFHNTVIGLYVTFLVNQIINIYKITEHHKFPLTLIFIQQTNQSNHCDLCHFTNQLNLNVISSLNHFLFLAS